MYRRQAELVKIPPPVMMKDIYRTALLSETGAELFSLL